MSITYRNSKPNGEPKSLCLLRIRWGTWPHGLRRCVMHLTECLASLLSLISRPIQAAKRTRMSMLCWGRRGVLGLWRLSALLGKTARSIPGWDRWRTGRRFGNQETGGPHEASIALSSSVFGYAIGQFAPNWLDDKSVPQCQLR